MHGFTPSPILTTSAVVALHGDRVEVRLAMHRWQQDRNAVESNLRFARWLSLRTHEVVSLFHARIGRHDCGVLILFNRRAARRHGPWRLTELASFKLGEPLPAVEVVAKAAS